MHDKGKISDAKAFVEAHESFLITSHLLPDADSVGSCVSLCLILRRLGKRADVVFPSPLPVRLAFLTEECPVYGWPHVDEVLAKDWEALIVLDSSDWTRVGPLMDDFSKRFDNILALDHHTGHQEFATVTVVDSNAPATASLVFELIKALQGVICPSVANALMTGLKGDTGSFSYANTTQSAFLMAAELMEQGCQLAEINKKLNERFSLAGIAFIQEGLSYLRTEQEGMIGWLPLPYELFSKHNATIQDAFPLMRYVRGIRGVRLAVVLYEDEPERVKISFRSRGEIDVGEFARSFGGGGHRAAAGMLMESPLSEAEGRILPKAKAVVGEEECNENQ